MKKDVSEHNLAPLAELEQALEQQGYGTVSLSLQVHKGKIVSLMGHQFQHVRFREGENAKAVAQVIGEIKATSQDKRSGTFTFSITFDEGTIKEIDIQRNLTRRYSLSEK